MNLEPAVHERILKYFATQDPYSQGNLHQRMQHVMMLANQHKESIPLDLWECLYDLETEVAAYEPAEPPYGDRKLTDEQYEQAQAIHLQRGGIS